jgi:hypothetical protein
MQKLKQKWGQWGLAKRIAASAGVAIAIAAVATAGWAWDTRSTALEAKKIARDYDAKTQAAAGAALASAGRFQACQQSALASKAQGDPDPASKFFDCYAPAVASAQDKSLTGPYLLFGAALMDPAAPDKAEERKKTLDQAYAQAEKTYEKEARDAVAFDLAVKSACAGLWSKRVCAAATSGMLKGEDKGYEPIERAPILLSQMVQIDVAYWQAQHPQEVREQLLAQSQAAASGDQKEMQKVVDAAPWTAEAKKSQADRKKQLEQWAEQLSR